MYYHIAMRYFSLLALCGAKLRDYTHTLHTILYNYDIKVSEELYIIALQMRISYDDQYLFSVGQDGSLFIFKVTDKDGRGLKREKDITFAEEVLVTKSDLEEKNTLMSELKTRVDELKMENDYQLRLKDMSYGEKIKDLSDKFLQEIEALKARNEVCTTTCSTTRFLHSMICPIKRCFQFTSVLPRNRGQYPSVLFFFVVVMGWSKML